MLRDGYNKYSFALPTKILSQKVNDDFTHADISQIGGICKLVATRMHQIDPTFSKNIFGFSPLLGAFIVLAAVILIIGIIIAVLYRIPGLFAFGFIMATGALVLMTMVLTGYVVSLGMLIGIFIGSIMGTFAVIGFMERIKKQIKAGVSFDSAFKKGMKRGILPSLDLHLVTLLASMCLVYFGSLEVSVLGISLLLYSLISMFMIMVGWFFTN
jgi:preprotein translocase subunit SecD